MRKLVLVILCVSFVVAIAANAHATIFSYKGHDYFLVKWQNVSWDAAKHDVENNYAGFSLAAITSHDEHVFIVENVLKGHTGEYWLGGYQNAGETNPAAGWKWNTGETFGYAKWQTNEPNDAHGVGSEQHLAMWSRFDWHWNDEGHLPNITGYIAESKAVSEPSTVMLLGFALLGMAGLSRSKFKQ